jgi:hypothetical protein
VGFAFGQFAIEVGLGGWMGSDLGDRDAMQRSVELTVAARVQAMADPVA